MLFAVIWGWGSWDLNLPSHGPNLGNSSDESHVGRGTFKKEVGRAWKSCIANFCILSLPSPPPPDRFPKAVPSKRSSKCCLFHKRCWTCFKFFLLYLKKEVFWESQAGSGRRSQGTFSLSLPCLQSNWNSCGCLGTSWNSSVSHRHQYLPVPCSAPLP